MMTCDTPSEEFDRSSSMLLIVLTASSILSVISVSTSSGAAPGRRVVTTTRATWTRHATTADDAGGEPYIVDLTQDDIARALDAAAAVGDDRIQRKTSGRVDPDRWTHGSAESRMRWFTIGLKKGTLRACDTFSTNQL